MARWESKWLVLCGPRRALWDDYPTSSLVNESLVANPVAARRSGTATPPHPIRSHRAGRAGGWVLRLNSSGGARRGTGALNGGLGTDGVLTLISGW